MALPTPAPGLVISYAYLCHEEAVLGQEEGVKDRPCVIVLAVEDKGGEMLVTVAPVTHRAPADPKAAVEIPKPVKDRLGLDTARSWVVITETNCFVWPGPDIRPIDRNGSEFAYGFLPPRLFRRVRDSLVAYYRNRRHDIVRRGG